MGLRAFDRHHPVFLGWFTFASFFSVFGYRWERLKSPGLLGAVGALVAVVGLLGMLPV